MRRHSKLSNSSSSSDKVILKKGPWTSDEDKVLLKFVDKYGPKDWSSIRSMGLLPRTGKSCRLRWVNKLRPNLKLGCKFTAEEEKVVIELQGRFGNKWATIASFLQGRTDNDVKNFWSTRQKRLARMIILNPPPSPPSPPSPPRRRSTGHYDSDDINGDSDTLLQFQSQPEFLIPDSMIAGLDYTSLSPLHESHLAIPPPLPPPPPQSTDETRPLLIHNVVIPVKTEVGGDFLDEFPASCCCCCYEAAQLLLCCCCFRRDDTTSSMGGIFMLEWNDDGKEEIEKLGTPDAVFDDLPPDIFDSIDPPLQPPPPPPPGGGGGGGGQSGS